MKKVLIVDDSPKIVFVTEKLIKLTEPGVETISATSGEEALQLILDENPNAVLLDILMPEMDGYSVCQKIKNDADTEHIPVVLVSSVEFNKENRLKAINAGADGFVTKPLDKQELKLQLRAMLKINEGNLQRKNEQQRLKELVDEQTRELRSELKLRKETEQKLQKHEKHLEELNATKDKFFSIIAHDLKTPFGNIVGLTDLIQRKTEQKNYDEINKLATLLKKAADHSYNLLNNLLEWSRTQLGKQNFNPKNANLCDLINGVISIFSVVAEGKEIKISTECPEKLYAEIDPDMIKTVLRNLVSNAIKYSYPGGEVKISAAENESEITVSVKDSGTGIDPKSLNKLFQIGEDVSVPGTKNEKGTGIGLILCKEFIEIHGGTIGVESESEKGSTFYFTLPKLQTGS